jgi:ABC-type sugar transport system ATPase subunit
MTSGDTKFSVRVEISEMLGSEKIAYFNLQGEKCSAKLSPNYNVGDSIELAINPDNVLFFDKESGDNIFLA